MHWSVATCIIYSVYMGTHIYCHVPSFIWILYFCFAYSDRQRKELSHPLRSCISLYFCAQRISSISYRGQLLSIRISLSSIIIMNEWASHPIRALSNRKNRRNRTNLLSSTTNVTVFPTVHNFSKCFFTQGHTRHTAKRNDGKWYETKTKIEQPYIYSHKIIS